jgi:hypothetical protein
MPRTSLIDLSRPCRVNAVYTLLRARSKRSSYVVWANQHVDMVATSERLRVPGQGFGYCNPSAFTLGSENVGSNINISVNGSALAPLTVSTAFPTAFLGVIDTSGPITNITFTVSNFQLTGDGEMDVIGSYATASAIMAPEVDPTSAASGLTLLLGGLAVLRGRREKSVA